VDLLRRLRVVLSITLVALVAGCSGSPSSSQTAPSVPALSPQAATLAYGYAATRNAQVAYQPDVVIVEGGPTIIRWASSDGLTWAIDPNAKGASDLKVGSVMFATSRAVGRVVSLQDADGSRIVTLAPIDLTELVSDADLHLDQHVDFGQLVYQEIPDLPGAVEVAGPATTDSPAPSTAADAGPPTAGAGNVVEMPPIRLVANHSNATIPPTAKACPKLSVGDWAVSGCSDPGKLSISVERSVNSVSGGGVSTGLKLGATITFRTDADLDLVGDEHIHGSKVTGSGGTITGLSGFDVAVSAGVANGASDNGKVTMELPIQVEYPIPPSPATGWLPFNFVVEFKFSVETAFSGKNSTLAASGSYALDGPIGVTNGNAVVPTLTVKSSMLSSLQGITIGPSGVVVAGKIKLQFGLGVPGSVAGPFVSVTESIGVAKGSALGTAIKDCRGITVAVFGGIGVGFQTNVDALTRLLGSSVKLKVEEETKFPVFNESQVEPPDAKICKQD